MARAQLKANLAPKPSKKKADLKLVDEKAIKTTSYSDINLKSWKIIRMLKTDTLWNFLLV